MKKIATPLYLLALAPVFAACASGPRPAMDPNSTITPLSLTPPPIYALLGFRRELDLTSEQVVALESIAVAVQEENSPLLTMLQANSRERQRYPGFYDLLPEVVPVLAEVRSNFREASEEVAAVLDEEQQSTVCRLFDPSRAGRFASRNAAPRASRGGTEMEVVRTPTGWSWCGEQEPAPRAVAQGTAQTDS